MNQKSSLREVPQFVSGGLTGNILIRGHQKVIEHYKQLLGSPSLSDAERRVIVENLARQQRDFRVLVGVPSTDKIAS